MYMLTKYDSLGMKRLNKSYCMVQLYTMDNLMWQNCNNDSFSQINYGVAEERKCVFTLTGS